MVAGYYRLPIVMVAVNRTLGPPWNIWVDQGDTLMLRDFAWLQFYCENNQEVLDTTLLAFRLAEDHRVLLAGSGLYGRVHRLAYAGRDVAARTAGRGRVSPGCRAAAPRRSRTPQDARGVGLAARIPVADVSKSTRR